MAVFPGSILVVAAHPDDEVLGCGGTIAKLASAGASVKVAFLADGVSSRTAGPEHHKQELEARRSAARNAASILGVDEVVAFGDSPDNQMDTESILSVTRKVEVLIAEHRPDTVITHHGGDLNIDHRRTYEAVVTACRPQQANPVSTILCCEVPSSTEWQLPGGAPLFAPNWFVDISGTFDLKLAALDSYASELREWPHPRSREGVEALARWRGATIGVDAAEAFMLGRHRA